MAAVIAVVVVMAAVGQAGGRACAATVSAGGTVSAARTVSAAGTVAGTVTHYVLSGTGLGLLAQNTGNPLASVQVAGPSGRWENLARADYNYWRRARRRHRARYWSRRPRTPAATPGC